MKRVAPIMLCIWPYFFCALLFFGSKNDGSLYLMGNLLFAVVMFICNIINVIFLLKGEYEAKKLAFWNMLIKLIHIPYYIIIFVIGIVLAMCSFVFFPFSIFMGPLMIISLIVSDYILMITSSMYGFSAIHRMRKAGQIKIGDAVLLDIMHCIFCFDVIVAIMTFGLTKKHLNNNEENIYNIE